MNKGSNAPEAENLDVLHMLQSVSLGIAKEIARICEDNGLTYSLVFGSLIGAVRHRGFIPWDDDLDIAMPRRDLDTFLELAPGLLPEHYEIHDFNFGNTNRYVTRVVDKRLLLQLDSYEHDNVLPAWVDIFVLDGIPETKVKGALHRIRINWHKALWAISSFDTVVNLNRPGRPHYQQIIISFCAKTRLWSHFDVKTRLYKYDKALRKYAFNYSSKCVCGVGSYSPSKQIWKREAFENLVEYEFEDTRFFAPVDYDSVLSVTYGCYMELPPVEKRIVHSIVIAKCSPEIYENK